MAELFDQKLERAIHSSSPIDLLEDLGIDLEELEGCRQDPIHHAEGNVLIHTKMVVESARHSSEFGLLSLFDQKVLFLAALMHDVGKPSCTVEDNGRITTHGHSRRGEILSRKLLWASGCDFLLRERVCLLIRQHQLPLKIENVVDLKRRVISASVQVPLSLLVFLARADALGRTCHDQANLLLSIEEFEQYAQDLGCLNSPYPFDSPVSRLAYLRSAAEHPYIAHDSTKSKVLVMSGLPGSGKDEYLKVHHPNLPIISLDAIREEVNEGPTGRQGPVFSLARLRAKVFLRAGTDFAWNATMLSRQMRELVLPMLYDYSAWVNIVYVEASPERLALQNKDRSKMIPPEVILKLQERWEVPTIDEAHQVEYSGPGVSL